MIAVRRPAGRDQNFRGNQRPDQRGEQRPDPRPESRGESRGEFRPESREHVDLIHVKARGQIRELSMTIS